MIKMKQLAFLFILLPLLAIGQTYIANVSVGDVENKKILGNQTVVIKGDVIADIKPSGKIRIPAGAIVIDGTGKFLFPGLVDAHVHFFQSGGLYTRPDAIDLRQVRPYASEIQSTLARVENVSRRYLKNGITTAIDPGSTYNMLKVRDGLQGQKGVAQIYMSGPLLTTYEPKVYAGLRDDSPFHLILSPEAARKAVQEQARHRPDFIKIWYIADVEGLSAEEGARKYLPVIQAAIDQAHELKFKVAVHAMERLTAELSVKAGCDYLVHSIEDEIIPDDLVRLIKQKNVIVCPTLTVHAGYVDTFAQRLDISAHEIAQADPFELGSLTDLKHLKLSDTALIGDYKRGAGSEKQQQKMIAEAHICNTNLKKLSDAGVTIATGTDAGNIGTLHACSYLDELLAMRKAGLSNWKILEASTINGAKVLGKQRESGSIAKGKKADLILLDANPADAIENVARMDRVIRHGAVFKPSDILVETPEELVQRQLNAYNFRNLEAFLDTYADDVEVYTFPDKLDYKGKETMRKIYGKMFGQTKDLHCRIVSRIVEGNIVIDKEDVRADAEKFGGTAIYVVENQKIKKVYFTQ